MPADAREAFDALFAIDSAMGNVVALSTEPQLARIKLAWWRERLEALDSSPPPAEPRLEAVARQLLPRGVTGAELAGLEPGWSTLADAEVDAALVAGRGRVLFRIGGKLLGSGDPKVVDAGAVYALASVARRGVPELVEPAQAEVHRLEGHRFERRARPLTMLARAAVVGLLRQQAGGKAIALAMLAHLWSGRIG